MFENVKQISPSDILCKVNVLNSFRKREVIIFLVKISMNLRM